MDVVGPSIRSPVSVNSLGRMWTVKVAVANLYIMIRVSAGRRRKPSVLVGFRAMIAGFPGRIEMIWVVDSDTVTDEKKRSVNQ